MTPAGCGRSIIKYNLDYFKTVGAIKFNFFLFLILTFLDCHMNRTTAGPSKVPHGVKST